MSACTRALCGAAALASVASSGCSHQPHALSAGATVAGTDKAPSMQSSAQPPLGGSGVGGQPASTPSGAAGVVSAAGSGAASLQPASAGQPSAGGSGASGASGASAGRMAIDSAGTSAAVGGSGAGAAGMMANAGDLWISPQGADTNPGTQAAPLKGLSAAHDLAKPGITIWVMPGNYPSSQTVLFKKNGEEQKPINVFASSTDGGERPVFDFSAQARGNSSARGIQISGNYWHIRGIDVIKAGDNCIHLSGSYNTLENVVVHGCDDTGIQITADGADAADPTRAAHNTILNCDSYENYDSANMGENADGFAAKLYIGPGNVFRGCRAWNNSDDGWDLFASDDVVVIDHCWAIANGKIGAAQNNTNGDGNGFKLGGAAKAGDANMGGAPHQVTNCISLGNRACGFVLNNNIKTPQLSMCGGQDNAQGLLCKLTNSDPVTVSSTASAAIMAKRNPDGSLPALP
jgi:hypothetical protein